MSIAYRQPSVAVDAARRRLRIECLVENGSAGTWRREDGFVFGSQVFDRARGSLAREGEWTPLGRDLAPGESGKLEVEVELPAEPGEYRVLVSPLDEKDGWRYLDQWPMLVVEAAVEDGEARLIRTRVATEERLRLESLPRIVRNAFWYPAAAVIRNRGLIRSMVRRDILARYRGSFGDVLWTVLNPLLLMTTYFFVFGIVLQARFGGDPSPAGFVLYFLAGMLPWLAFSEAVGRSAHVVLEHRTFVKKLVFPIETLPVNLVISGLITQAFATGIFVIGLLLARGSVPATVLWLPSLLIPQLLLTLGLCWFLAALGVYMRDLGQIMGFVLTLWFFLTPICYPESSLPASIAPLLAKNPLYKLVQGYRAIFLEGAAPFWPALRSLYVYSVLACILGYASFHKLRKSFADVI
ncbi:MAG: ABC transporter permease [Bryobacteraceae bacterium]